MNERLVLCCWWADGKVAAEQRLLLAERVSQQVLGAGGTEIAWGASSCCFDFEPSELSTVLDVAQRLIGHGLVEQAAVARREMGSAASGRAWGPALVMAEGLAGLADQGELVLDASLQGVCPQYFSGTAQRRVVLNGEVVAAGRLLLTVDGVFSSVESAADSSVGSRGVGNRDVDGAESLGAGRLDSAAGGGDSARDLEPSSSVPSSSVPSWSHHSAPPTGAVARSPLPPVPSVPAPSIPAPSIPAPLGEGFEVAPTIPSVYPSGPPSVPELMLAAVVAEENAEAEQRPTNPEVPRPSAPPNTPRTGRAVLRAPTPDLTAPRPLRSIGTGNGSLARKAVPSIVAVDGVEPAVRNSTPPPKPTAGGPSARSSTPPVVSDAPAGQRQGRATPPPYSPRRSRRPSAPSPYPVPDLPRAVVSSNPPPKPRRSQPSANSSSNPPSEGTHSSSKPPRLSTPPHSSQPAQRRLSQPPPKPHLRSSLPPPPPKRSKPPSDDPAVDAAQRTSSNPPHGVDSDRASVNPTQLAHPDRPSSDPDRSSLNPVQPSEVSSAQLHDSHPPSQASEPPQSSEPERHSQPPDAAGLWRLREGVSKSRPLGGLLHGHACLSLATGLAKAGRPTEALLEALEALARARDAKNAALERSCVRLLEKFARSAGFDDVAEGWLAVGK